MDLSAKSYNTLQRERNTQEGGVGNGNLYMQRSNAQLPRYNPIDYPSGQLMDGKNVRPNVQPQRPVTYYPVQTMTPQRQVYPQYRSDGHAQSFIEPPRYDHYGPMALPQSPLPYSVSQPVVCYYPSPEQQPMQRHDIAPPNYRPEDYHRERPRNSSIRTDSADGHMATSPPRNVRYVTQPPPAPNHPPPAQVQGRRWQMANINDMALFESEPRPRFMPQPHPLNMRSVCIDGGTQTECEVDTRLPREAKTQSSEPDHKSHDSLKSLLYDTLLQEAAALETLRKQITSFAKFEDKSTKSPPKLDESEDNNLFKEYAVRALHEITERLISAKERMSDKSMECRLDLYSASHVKGSGERKMSTATSGLSKESAVTIPKIRVRTKR